MVTLSGKSVCGGIAFGTIYLFEGRKTLVKRTHIEDSESETERYIAARDKAIDELELLFYKANKEIGEAEAQIFSIHRMMLEDADYNESIKNIITKQQLNAETAVLMTADTFSGMFAEMEDAYMQARAADVRDISDRVIRILSGEEAHQKAKGENIIIFAEDLTPSETLQMDKDKIVAFVTEKGSAASHTAILARSMDIPAIVGVAGLDGDEFDGKTAVIDGYTGTVYIEPTAELVKVLTDKKNEKEEQKKLLKNLKNKPTVTLDGKTIKLYANIGTPQELGGVIMNDAEGIGLFRSEFLYLESDGLPSEDAQFEAYRKVAEGMGEKPVIIRTLDIGADKKLGYLDLPKEENPALGFRAIRICLEKHDVFKTQLRAILRASAFGNIMIMLPMIVSKEEIREAKKVLFEAQEELLGENIPFCEKIPLGIMIETPAAVMISDILAQEVDFFSVGTNDLTQYMLACDRQNSKVSHIADSRHEAILRAISIVTKNAHDKGIWAGICGELGADIEFLPRLLELGVDEISVASGKLLEARKKIRESYYRKED